jgi:hypothetical protein
MAIVLGVHCGGGVEEPWIHGASWMKVFRQSIVDTKVVINMFLKHSELVVNEERLSKES